MKDKKEADHASGIVLEYRLNNKDKLEYTFTSRLNSLSEIMVFIDNDSAMHESCSFNVELLNSDKQIYNKKIKNTDMKETYITMKFDEIKNSKGKRFTLIINNNCKKAMKISLYDKSDDSIMTYNDNTTQKGIGIREIAYVSSHSYLWYPVMLLLFGLLTYAMSSNKKGEKNVKKTRKK